MQVAEFLYDGFILRVSYHHTEVERETGTPDQIEVVLFDYITEQKLEDRTISSMQNLTPFVQEFCPQLFADFEDKLRFDEERDFRIDLVKSANDMFEAIAECLRPITTKEINELQKPKWKKL